MISDHVALTRTWSRAIPRRSTTRSSRWPGWPAPRRGWKLARGGDPAVSPPAAHRAAGRQRRPGCSGGDSSSASGWAGPGRSSRHSRAVRRRGAMSNDYLAAIKTAWTSDRRRTVSIRLVPRRARPAGPLRSPHPPIWSAAPATPGDAPRRPLGDAWHPIRIRIPWLRDTACRGTRDRGQGGPAAARAVPAHPPARHRHEAGDEQRIAAREASTRSGATSRRCRARRQLRAVRHLHGRRRGDAAARARLAHAHQLAERVLDLPSRRCA